MPLISWWVRRVATSFLRGRGGRDAVDGGSGNDLCSAEVERGCEL
ncbi:MAG: hypothetical protein ACRDPQ_09560 [Nocardioidaceae bacterium]